MGAKCMSLFFILFISASQIFEIAPGSSVGAEALGSSKVCRPLPARNFKETPRNISLHSLLSQGISKMTLKDTPRNSPLSAKAKYATFVLGNTGSGKSTLLQIIAGNLNHLHATQTPGGSLVIFDDEGRIGAPTTESKTLFPEYINNPENGDGFWDCPGFDDNRGPKTDIAAMYFVKYALDITSHAKFLFTVSHSAVRPGNDRLDFDLMVTHAVRLLANVTKFRDSVGLVVTKVGSFSPATGMYQKDEHIMQQIKGFMSTYISTKAEQAKRANVLTDKVELEKKVEFVNGLIGVDNPTKTVRYFFSRSPTECGRLSEMSSILESRQKIRDLCNNGLMYSNVTPNDFRITLKENTLRLIQTVYIPESVFKIIENFNATTAELQNVFFEKLYAKLCENTQESTQLLNLTVTNLNSYLGSLENNATEIKDHLRLAKSFHSFISKLGVKLNSTMKQQIKEHHHQLEFFLNVLSPQISLSIPILNWLQSLRDLSIKLVQYQEFYEFYAHAEFELERRQSMLMKVIKTKNITEEIENGNVLSLLVDNKLIRVPLRFRAAWGAMGSLDKTYLENLVKSIAFQINCKPIPPRKSAPTIDEIPLKRILSDGLQNMDNQITKDPNRNDTFSRVIFMLGNTGSGKSTATQIIAGNLSRLHGVYTDAGNLVIVDDDDRIGLPTTKSKSLIPEYVINRESGIAFWDCPGFDDNRSPILDIAAMKFVRYAVDTTTHAKFLFTVAHSSVTAGNNRLDFDVMVTHATHLLQNVNALKPSIGLLVTKVESYSKNTGDYMEDGEILAEIRKFLKSYVTTHEDGYRKTTDAKAKASLENKILFVKNILEVDAMGNSRLQFLRSPDSCGNLGEMQPILETRRKLVNLYSDVLNYSEVTANDFQFTLQAETLRQVQEYFIPKATENLDSAFSTVLKDTTDVIRAKYFNMLYTGYVEDGREAAISFLNNIAQNMDTILSLANSTTVEHSDFARSFEQLHGGLGLSVKCEHAEKICTLAEELDLFYSLTKYHNGNSILIQAGSQHILNFYTAIEILRNFTIFCGDAEIQLAQYQSQLYFADLLKRNLHNFTSEDTLNFLHNNRLVNVSSKIYQLWTKIGSQEKKYLAGIVSSRWVPHLDITCTSSNIDKHLKRVLVSGRNVILSVALDTSKWDQNCRGNLLKEITVIGAERVYFDKDILKEDKELHISIIASSWVITKSHRINLNGLKPKGYPKPGKSTGRRGINGVAGRRGGDAGSFFGIYYDISNEQFLLISANAGDGGNGQDGGDGSDGKDGIDASMDQFPDAPNVYWKRVKHDLYCGDKFRDVNIIRFSLRGHPGELGRYTRCSARGHPGELGYHGGNGGKSGSPGMPGSIEIFRASPSYNVTIKLLNQHGHFGIPGRGGRGGIGGKKGNNFVCTLEAYSFFHQKWVDCEASTYKNIDSSKSNGMKGYDGATDRYLGRRREKSSFKKWKIISEYKTMFYNQESKISDTFMERMHKQKEILSAMCAKGFAHELDTLEQRIFTTTKITNDKTNKTYSPNYHRIFKWLLAYVNHLKTSGRLLREEKTAINIIQGTILGRLGNLRRVGYRLNVIKTKDFFGTQEDQLKTIESFQKLNNIQSETEIFQNSLGKKVLEAENFVSSVVQPAIMKAYDDLKEQNDVFLSEINEFLTAVQVDLEAKKKAIKNYENAGTFQTIMGVLNAVGTLCQFFGSYGKIASVAISTGTSVAQTIETISTREKRSASEGSINFNASVLPSGHIDYFNNKINKTEILINEAMLSSKNSSDDNLRKIFTKASQTNTVLTLLKTSVNNKKMIQSIQNETKLDESFNDLKEATFQKAEQLENENTISRSNSARIITGLAVAMETGNAVSSLVNSYSASKEELGRLKELKNEAERKVTALENLRKHFYDRILPAIDSTINNMNKEINDLKGQTLVGLSVKEWEIKSLLRDMRGFIQQFTKSFQVAEQYQLSFDAIDEALTLLIDLYEHIERYQEKKEFANFIANINSDDFKVNDITDTELRSILTSLEFSIKKNLFIEDYHKAMHAFKQWVFPFANNYLQEASQVACLEIAPTPDELVKRYKTQFKTLENELAKYQATTVKSDEYTIVSTFTSDGVSSEPFYVWSNSNWQDSIKRLLSGQQVHLKADTNLLDQSQEIKNYFRDKTAIKFKVIELVFRAQNDSRRKELDQKLNEFHMEMTHSGISVYKVTDKHFTMLDKPQSYRYSFERTNTNDHVSVNGVKYKVNTPDADFLMSPYTWWTFQLTDAKPNSGVEFDDLTEFAKEVDLELQGHGVYLDQARLTPKQLNDLNLEKYYSVYESDHFPLESLSNQDGDKRCYF